MSVTACAVSSLHPHNKDSIAEGEASLTNSNLHVTARLLFYTDRSDTEDEVVMLLQCRSRSFTTRVLGLKLVLWPSNKSTKAAMDSSRIECACRYGSERLINVDGLRAAENSRWKSVVICREYSAFQMSQMRNMKQGSKTCE